MGPIEHIRREVLKISQAELARVAETTQPTVSRWERGKLEPSRAELAKIRQEITEKNLQWSDSWFFDAPRDPAPSLEEAR
jgi:transcriptional regulator with XRE-family HTH domain